MLKFGRYLCLLLIPLLVTTFISACATPLQPIKAVDRSQDSSQDSALGDSLDDSVATAGASFSDALMAALTQRDYAGLQGMMGHSFGLVQWGGAAVERPPAIAVLTLRDRYLGAGSAVAFAVDADRVALLADLNLDALWDQPLELADTLYITGLGMNQRDEAMLLIARAADESLYWRGIVVAPGGFAADVATSNAITLNVSAQENRADLAAPTAPVDVMAAISLTAALVPIPPAKADALPAAPARIELQQDAPDTRLRGILQATQSRLYLLHGAEGQLLTVAVASNAGMANFSITGVDDGQPYKRLGDEARSWQDTLSTTQDYLITVASTVALPFELTITTDPAALSAATAATTSSTSTP